MQCIRGLSDSLSDVSTADDIEFQVKPRRSLFQRSVHSIRKSFRLGHSRSKSFQESRRKSVDRNNNRVKFRDEFNTENGIANGKSLYLSKPNAQKRLELTANR